VNFFIDSRILDMRNLKPKPKIYRLKQNPVKSMMYCTRNRRKDVEAEIQKRGEFEEGFLSNGNKSSSKKFLQHEPNLKELLKKSNVIICCLPLNNQTRGIIGIEELEIFCKSGCETDMKVLVNIARGPIVDTDAVCFALTGCCFGSGFSGFQQIAGL